MVQLSSQNSGGKVVFYGWVPRNPPWAPTGVKVPWSLKSVNISKKTNKQTNKQKQNKTKMKNKNTHKKNNYTGRMLYMTMFLSKEN